MSFLKKFFVGNNKSENSEKLDVAEKVDQAPALQTNKLTEENNLTVNSGQILLNAHVVTKNDVLKLISRNFSSLGLVSGNYLDALMAREKTINTYLVNGVAIPHGVNKAKEQVIMTGVFIVQVPGGVVWNDKGDMARLIVGIAAKDKDHLSLLQRLSNVVMDETLAEQLATTTDKNDILNALNVVKQASPNQLYDYTATGVVKITNTQETHIRPANLIFTDKVKVVDTQGMHIQAACLISEQAARFSGTDIRIRNNQRTVNAKSMASLLSMGASLGDVLTISAEGFKAEMVVHLLTDIIGHEKFGDGSTAISGVSVRR